MGSSDKARQEGYSKGYYRGRKTGERKAKEEKPPLDAGKQQKALNEALERLRKP